MRNSIMSRIMSRGYQCLFPVEVQPLLRAFVSSIEEPSPSKYNSLKVVIDETNKLDGRILAILTLGLNESGGVPCKRYNITSLLRHFRLDEDGDLDFMVD